MFKRANKILPPDLTSSGKLKQKIWGISAILLSASSLLVDVVNVRSGSHQNGMLLLIKNIPLLIPWVLAYLIASRNKDLLKIFTPLYLSLVLLVTTISLALNSQNLEEKIGKEMANIGKDFVDFLDGKQSVSPNQPSTYSADEYGHFAIYLNKLKQSMELSKQEIKAVDRAFNEVELDKAFTDEVLFNFFNIIDKKKKLERLLVFLDESEKRTEGNYSEFATWMLSSPDVDEISCKNFADAYYKAPEEKKFFRQEPYRIKKNIVQEYITFLDFLSKAYGSYGRGEDAQILFTNDKDLQAWRSHGETIEKLFKEEENFALLFQQRVTQMGKSLPTMTKMSDDPIHTTEEYDLSCLDQISEFCKQEAIFLGQAFAEIDVNSICTEEVFLNFAKITERKKKLEQMSVILEENEKRWEKQLPDLVQRILSSSHLSDRFRRKVEDFNKTMPILGKQSFTLKKKYVLEFINLLNLLSMRYGTYNINNQGLCFSSEIESKIYESYLKDIRSLLEEEKDVDLLIQQHMQDLSK